MAAPMLRRGFLAFARNNVNFVPIGHRQFPKLMSRYIKRRPIAVYNQKEANNLEFGSRKRKIGKDNLSSSDFEESQHENDNLAVNSDHNNTEEDKYAIPPDIKYITLKEGDKRFGPLVNFAKSRKSRYKHNLILLEGRHLVEEAHAVNLKIKSLYFTSGKQLEGLPLEDFVENGTGLFKVKMNHMALWSDVNFPSGIMAVCAMPAPGELQSPADVEPLPLTLILDDIKESGFMGTLLRSAAGVGCKRVLITKGCVDIWEPKVLRAGCGCHFHVPIINNISWELLSNYLEADSTVYLADSRSEDTITADTPTLSKAQKRRIMNHSSPTTKTYTAEESSESRMVIEESYLDDDLLEAFDQVSLTARAFDSVDYSGEGGGEVVVVVSGEAGESSAQSKKLAYERHGERVCMPLATGVDRLNPAVSASLVLFEVKRQLRLMRET